jgi:hypothetical protein
MSPSYSDCPEPDAADICFSRRRQTINPYVLYSRRLRPSPYYYVVRTCNMMCDIPNKACREQGSTLVPNTWFLL